MIEVDAQRIRLPQAVTVREVPSLMPQLRQALRQGARLLDWQAVHKVDSAAIALVLSLRREFGQSWQLVAVPASLTALAKVYGVAFVVAEAAT